MPLRQVTPQSQINKHLEQEIQKREKKIIKSLNYIGMTCIAEARNNGNYIDQTGNLRSSIGYAILKNGTPIKTLGFQKVKKGDEGLKKGENLIKSVAYEFGSGYVLIVVAGMNYAAYVETKRNVISSSEILAKQLAENILTKLGFTKR